MRRSEDPNVNGEQVGSLAGGLVIGSDGVGPLDEKLASTRSFAGSDDCGAER